MGAAVLLKQAAQPSLTDLGATQADFRRLTMASRLTLTELAERLAQGALMPREWAEEVYRELLRSHAGSWMLGRLRIGEEGAFGLLDALRGRERADAEGEFLLGFLRQIEDGKYTDEDGNIDAARVARRSGWYTGRYRGTANEAMREHAPEEAECWWRLGAVEEHCADCPVLTVLSPFTKDTLFQVPGDNETPCKFNCKCHLEWVLDGAPLNGFKPV